MRYDVINIDLKKPAGLKCCTYSKYKKDKKKQTAIY